jgi:hypothetical protein
MSGGGNFGGIRYKNCVPAFTAYPYSKKKIEQIWLGHHPSTLCEEYR